MKTRLICVAALLPLLAAAGGQLFPSVPLFDFSFSSTVSQSSLLCFDATTKDVCLQRDAADVLAQRRGTNPQTFRVYNTYTDGSNYERGFAQWLTNVFQVGTEAAGTGVGRNVSILSANDVLLGSNGANRWRVSASVGPHSLITVTDNVYDIGAAGATRPRTGYFGTSVLAPTINATTAYQLNGVAGVGFALSHATPADQSGNATATFKMLGLGAAGSPCTITPTSTGRVVFTLTGDLTNAVILDGVTYKLAYGTGAAPANNAAATGTVISATRVAAVSTAAQKQGFSVTSSVTGLGLVATWFDVQFADVTGGMATITNVDCTAHEI
jgi:hypothetical protein